MKAMWIITVAVWTALSPQLATAQASDNEASKLLNGATVADVYSGLIIDQTRTRNGKEFAEAFINEWREFPLSERYSIAMKEQPSARFGSRMSIEFGNRNIFHARLPAGRVNIRTLGAQAANASYKYITETEMQRLLFRDHDLGPDEIN